MTAALFGGAFDPPHDGHVALLRAAKEAFRPEHAVVLVVAAPGHKEVHASPEHRLALTRAAFPGEQVELDHHARTVDMLRDRREIQPLLLVGADELEDFLAWKEPDAVLELATLAVATRPGSGGQRLDRVLGRLARPERLRFFEIEPVPVSSTEVRRRVAAGEPIQGLVPPAVAAAIADLGVYRG